MATVADTSGKTTGKGSGSDSDAGPGEVAEAVPVLVAELVKAPPAVKPDPNVSTAVATGWHAREALAAAVVADEAKKQQAPRRPTEKGHLWAALDHFTDGIHNAFLTHPAEERQSGQASAVRPAPPAFVAHENGAGRDGSYGYFLAKADTLEVTDRIALVCAQLTADVALLGKPLKTAGQDSAQVTSAITAFAGAKRDREAKALVLGSLFAQQLIATDFRLGKGFALGWDLAALAHVSGEGDAYRQEFARRFLRHVADITDRLTLLASVLPANAGHSVRESVRLWTGALAQKPVRGVPAPIDVQAMPVLHPNDVRHLPNFSPADIAVQLERWRALLTAEKAAKDELEPVSYVKVAGGLAGELASAVRVGAGKAKGAMLFLAVVIVLLVGLGVAAVFLSSSSGVSAAGVTALVGAVGLTWKGIGGTVGRGLARVEQPAWDAQMDRVIAEAITNREIVDLDK